MRKMLFGIILFGLMLSFGASAAPGSTDSSVAKKLAEVRQTTEKYHNVDSAITDGYIKVGDYVPNMGQHYLNPTLAADLIVNELTPEILLYDRDGKLVGVEYFVASIGQPSPILFGRAMNGPMPGHSVDQPVHYDLHVYIWRGNPKGIFEIFNPTVDK